MKAMLVLAAALACAATPANAQRFRYLGEGGGLAVLAGDNVTGPSDAREFSLAVAVGGRTGPKGSNSFIAEMRADCVGGTMQLLSVAAYAGEAALPVEEGPAPATPPEPGTPFHVVYAYVCNGKAPEGAAVWIEGPDAARAYARDRASENL